MYRKNRIICRNFERVELFLGSFAFSWEQRKLGELYTERNEQGNKSLQILSVSIHSGVSDGELDVDGLGKKVRRSEDKSTYKHVYAGDLIFNMMRAWQGAIGVSKNEGMTSPAYISAIPNEEVYPPFMNYLLRRKDAINQINNLSYGVTDFRKRLYWNSFVRVTCQLPCVAEQKRITETFEKLDNLLTLHQRKVHINTKRPMGLSENGRSLKTISWEQRKVSDVITDIARPIELMDNQRYQLVTVKRRNEGVVSRGFMYGRDILVKNYYEVHSGDYLISKRQLVHGANGVVPECLNNAVVSNEYMVCVGNEFVSADFLALLSKTKSLKRDFFLSSYGVDIEKLVFDVDDWKKRSIILPTIEEQSKICAYFHYLDHLLTLHQRKSPSRKNWRCVMIKETRGNDLFHEYYTKWITVYKKGAIRKVTMDKYLMTQKWLEKLIPDLRVCDMNRIAYQQLLNDYAEHHERQTTMDFHHQLKGAILDAVDEGLIDRDPTRKAIIKGRTPTSKKVKYLNQFELHTLLTSLELKNEVNWDYFILLVAKTGMRFSEALALTPKDFDFSHQTLSINKTWDYKGKGGFQPTKNKSSIRKIQIDWQTVIQFSELVKGVPKDQPIFVKSNVYNSTVNDILGRYCERSNIPVISIHGLRHTHASLLLFAGVSIASVARRLGHSSMTTTQKTYLHIIQELENKDIDLVMRSLSGLS